MRLAFIIIIVFFSIISSTFATNRNNEVGCNSIEERTRAFRTLNEIHTRDVRRYLGFIIQMCEENSVSISKVTESFVKVILNFRNNKNCSRHKECEAETRLAVAKSIQLKNDSHNNLDETIEHFLNLIAPFNSAMSTVFVLDGLINYIHKYQYDSLFANFRLIREVEDNDSDAIGNIHVILLGAGVTGDLNQATYIFHQILEDLGGPRYTLAAREIFRDIYDLSKL